MIVKHPERYTLIRIEVAPRASPHKYYLILQHRERGQLKRVPFGGKRADGTPYEQYHDRIGHYARYDHWDRARRARYRIRHAGEAQAKFSSGWASWIYLW